MTQYKWNENENEVEAWNKFIKSSKSILWNAKHYHFLFFFDVFTSKLISIRYTQCIGTLMRYIYIPFCLNGSCVINASKIRQIGIRISLNGLCLFLCHSYTLCVCAPLCLCINTPTAIISRISFISSHLISSNVIHTYTFSILYAHFDGKAFSRQWLERALYCCLHITMLAIQNVCACVIYPHIVCLHTYCLVSSHHSYHDRPWFVAINYCYHR